jgi:hypothetical protein
MMCYDHYHSVSTHTCYLTSEYREGPIHISPLLGVTNLNLESLGFLHLQLCLRLNLSQHPGLTGEGG